MAGGQGRARPGVPLGERGKAPREGGTDRPWAPTAMPTTPTQGPVPGTFTPRYRHAWVNRPGQAPAAVLVLRWSRSAEGWMATVVMADEMDRGVLVTVPADQLTPVPSTDPTDRGDETGSA